MFGLFLTSKSQRLSVISNARLNMIVYMLKPYSNRQLATSLTLTLSLTQILITLTLTANLSLSLQRSFAIRSRKHMHSEQRQIFSK